eukprot:355640-Chlamydomonas_euryale.AAC.2
MPGASRRTRAAGSAWARAWRFRGTGRASASCTLKTKICGPGRAAKDARWVGELQLLPSSQHVGAAAAAAVVVAAVATATAAAAVVAAAAAVPAAAAAVAVAAIGGCTAEWKGRRTNHAGGQYKSVAAHSPHIHLPTHLSARPLPHFPSIRPPIRLSVCPFVRPL